MWFHFCPPITDSHRGLVEEDGDGLDLPLVDPVQRVEVEVEELAEPALLELLQLRKQIGKNNSVPYICMGQAKGDDIE